MAVPLTGPPGPRGWRWCAPVQFLVGSFTSLPPLTVGRYSCLLPLLRRRKPHLRISRHSVLQLRTSEMCLFFPCVQTLLLFPPAADSTPAPNDASGPFLNCSVSRRFQISGPVSDPQRVNMLTEYFIRGKSGQGAVGVPLNPSLKMKQLGCRKKTGPR